MRKKVRKSILATKPASVLSIGTAVLSLPLIFILAFITNDILGVTVEKGNLIAYSAFGILIPIACFLICKFHPKSIWYSVIVCNAMGIIAAVGEPTFWETSLWMVFVAGWILSVLGGIAGTVVGLRTAK